MAPISSVALLGAGGTLGRYVLQSLIDAGYAVTILRRPGSSPRSYFPPSVPVVETDYELESLKEAFRGKDAVVSVVGIPAFAAQTVMMDAAEAVGVKRFVLSQFGNTPEYQATGLPEMKDASEKKQEMLKYAMEKAEKNKDFTWSALATGHFLDWAIKKFTWVGFDIDRHAARLYDSGNKVITATCMADIGTAVAGILKNPEATANKHLRVRSLEVTQSQILAAFEEATGAKWTVEYVDTKKLAVEAREKRAKTGDRMAFFDLLMVQLFAEDSGRPIVTKEEADNDLLGIREQSVADMVKRILDPSQLPLD